MATRLKKLSIDRVDLVDAGANPDAHVVLFKRDSSEGHEPLATPEATVADDIKKNLDEATARIAELEAIVTGLDEMSVEDLAALKGFEIAKADPQEEVLKGLPEDVRKRLEDSEAKIAKMEADARVESFTKRAQTEFAKVGDHAEIGELLASLPADKAEAVEKVLRSADARIDMSKVLATVGTDGEGSEDSVEAEVAKRAVETKTEGETLADAKMRVIREDKALQERWASATV